MYMRYLYYIYIPLLLDIRYIYINTNNIFFFALDLSNFCLYFQTTVVDSETDTDD